jgi:hypothetical protein
MKQKKMFALIQLTYNADVIHRKIVHVKNLLLDIDLKKL